MDFLTDIKSIPSTFNINFARENTESKEFSESIPKNLENFDFEFAPVTDPSSFCDSIKSSAGDEHKIMDFHKGTTTLG